MKRIITLGFVLAGLVSYGQQLPQYSQYHRNQIMVNPGAVGAYDFLDITVGGRYQWLGFNNDVQGNVSPKTAYLYGANVLRHEKVRYNPALRISNGPIRNPKVGTGKMKHAIGGQVVLDEYGAFQNLQFAGMYALHIPLSREVNMSFGAKLGLSNHSFLQERAQVLSDMTGGVSDQAYAGFIANGASRMFMDLGAGLYVYSDKFFVGISSDQLTTDLVSIGSGTTNFNPKMHFQGTAGIKLDMGEKWTVMPALLAKLMPPAPLSIEGTIQFEYEEWLWFGASYRHTDAVVAMLGANISQRFKIGYSYDYSLSRFNNYSSGGHEVVLGFMIR